MNKRFIVVFLFLLIAIIIADKSFAGSDGLKTKNHSNSISKTNANSITLRYNNFELPVNNDGRLAGFDGLSGRYKDKCILFTGGFHLSGYNDNKSWGNGVMYASRIVDYQPGPVGSLSTDSKNKVYLVTSTDFPFGAAYEEWKDAVALGADFYDGDHDGVYNPVDKNGNGKWDVDEDRPDLLGDFTAFCVYNDAVKKDFRRYTDIDPVGIEIRQSVFGIASYSDYGNALFVRYRIINRGTVNNVLDSVYFAAAVDPDLGEGSSDLVGCDTMSNLGYAYNDGPNTQFGVNCPSFAVSLMQGPAVYLPGVTYNDVNKNGKYDQGIDTPLKKAVNNKGRFLGVDTIPGAMNLQMTSFTQYMQSNPTHGDPSSQSELRNYLIGGLSKHGVKLSPCSWAFGNGSSLQDCNSINPKFMYSGNPVTKKGWINTTPIDQRFLVNTGQFKLEKDKPVDIIVAYIIGQGESSLGSVDKVFANNKIFKKYFDSNFTTVTGVHDEVNTVKTFDLFQNYPNPFNPSTNIKYSVPSTQRITIKVFNVLGQTVKTLVDEIKSRGTHEVVFDAGKLSSGIYFYELKSADNSIVKKLILAK